MSFSGFGPNHLHVDIFNVINPVGNLCENTWAIEGTAEGIHYPWGQKFSEDNCLFFLQNILLFSGIRRAPAGNKGVTFPCVLQGFNRYLNFSKNISNFGVWFV